MKSDRGQGRIATVWREYFLDRGYDPPEWKPHPHDRYKLGGRIFLAFKGSLLIVLPILVILSFPKVIFASKSVSLTLAAGCGLRLSVFRASEAPGRFKR